LCILTLMCQLLFLCPASCLNCAALSQASLLEVPVTYLGSLRYFPAWGPVLPDGRSLERLLLMGVQYVQCNISGVIVAAKIHL
jgi:hypothetical protein